MIKKDTITEIHKRAPERYLTRDKSGKGFICPICGSGSGPNGTGITTDDGVHYTCWAKKAKKCFSHADIIDIIGLKEGITDYPAKVRRAAAICGLEVEEEPYISKAKHISKHVSIAKEEESARPGLKDYSAFYLEAAKAINDTGYHRGLTQETLTRFNVGYVKEWKNPKAPKAPPSPRLIIPTGKHSYVARDVREDLTEKERAFSKIKVGPVELFNGEALYNSTGPVFITEGEIDALSVIDVGGQAVGLGGTSQVGKLLATLKAKPPTQRLIIALDSDDPGIRAAAELREGLERLGIPYSVAGISAGCKDPNEALLKDREAFTKAVESAVERARCEEAEAKDAAIAELEKEAVAYALDGFLKRVEASKNRAFYSTGFNNLDAALDGGLYAGLYVIGAISSLGKTTFTLQLADQLARQGYDILVFSLEMARDELIAKSLSRLTYFLGRLKGLDRGKAKTTRGILTGSRYEKYSQQERDLIDAAIFEYKEYGARLYITEGVGEVGIEQIKEKVKKHYTVTGRAPVVIIDYLQILTPFDARATDKQNTDRAVLELKRLSRDFNIPVIGISSFNRENYLAPVNLASFKESGAIEYSSDVLIGLQYKGMDYQEGDGKEATRSQRVRELRAKAEEAGKKGDAQEIQVKILKNRNGSRGDVTLKYFPMFNCFIEEKPPKVIGSSDGAALL